MWLHTWWLSILLITQAWASPIMLPPPEEVTFTTKTDKLIRGDTIILDVSSLHPQSASTTPLYGTEQSCSEGCRRTPGCNAWAVCADPDGCGQGCLQYTQDHPQMTALPQSGPLQAIPEPAWSGVRSFDRLGPYGKTGTCQVSEVQTSTIPSIFGQTSFGTRFGTLQPRFGSLWSPWAQPQTAATDKWAYGTCTLLKIANPKKRVYANAANSKGWTSGHASTVASCEGLPIQACTQCQSTSDPPKCVTCAKERFAELPLLEAVFYPNTAAECFAPSTPWQGGEYIPRGTYKGCKKLRNHEQACINSWVMQQQVGILFDMVFPSCGGLQPKEHQQCINKWITDNLQAGACGAESSAGYQSCLNSLVDAKMQAPRSEPLSLSSNAKYGTYGGCKALHSAHKQDCYSFWVVKQQVGVEYDAVWPTCEDSASTPEAFQECVNNYIVDTYVNPAAIPGEPRRVGGCTFAPTRDPKEDARLYQGCLNQVVETQMAATANSGLPSPSPPVATEASCTGLGPEALQECVNRWVSEQVVAKAPPGSVGGGCYSMGPSNVQQCVNGWIQENLLNAPGTPGGPMIAGRCSFRPSGDTAADGKKYQGCLNQLVVKAMAEAATTNAVSPSPSPPADSPGYGRTFIARGTYKGCRQLYNHEQQCINSWVMQQQVGRMSDMVFASCGGLEPAEQQRCVNQWITINLQASSCGPESSDGYQACLNTLVDAKMQAPTSAPRSFDGDIIAGTYGGCSKLHSANQQDCINFWVVKQQVGIEYDAIYPTCESASSSPSDYQQCVNRVIVDTYVNPPAQPGKPRLVGMCRLAPTGDAKQDDRRYQECLNQVVESQMAAAANSGVSSPSPSPVVPTGSSCTGLGPELYQDCVNRWVSGQVEAKAPPGSVGGGCYSMGPDNVQPCVNRWIQQNLLNPPARPGEPVLIADRCFIAPSGNSATDDKQFQDCLNKLVENAMAASNTTPSSPANSNSNPASPDNPTYGTTYIARGTYKGCLRLRHHYQECVNDYVLKQQVGRTFDYILPSCGGLAADELQTCINSWIVDNLQGGACGTESSNQNYQNCLNTLVDEKMQAPTSTPLSFDGDIIAGTYGGCSKLDSANYQDCINVWVVKQQVGIEYDAIWPTCEDANSSTEAYQECVNAWIWDNLLKLEPGDVGACHGLFPEYQQSCLNSAVDAKIEGRS